MTQCIDCGTETKPGKGSARCPECWEDRCGERCDLSQDLMKECTTYGLSSTSQCQEEPQS